MNPLEPFLIGVAAGSVLLILGVVCAVYAAEWKGVRRWMIG